MNHHRHCCNRRQQLLALAVTNPDSLGTMTVDQRPRHSPPPLHPDPPIAAAAPTSVHNDGGSTTSRSPPPPHPDLPITAVAPTSVHDDGGSVSTKASRQSTLGYTHGSSLSVDSAQATNSMVTQDTNKVFIQVRPPCGRNTYVLRLMVLD